MSEPADSQTRLTREAMKIPLLAREQEYDLARRWAETHDEAALHVLVRAHMRLAIAIARRFRNYGLPMSDLVQEGHIGLLEAAARFETSHEVRFSTYATWWIRAAIQDYVLRNWSIVRGGTSSGQKALFFNLRRMRARLERSNEDGTTPRREEMHATIAHSLGVNPVEVARMDARLNIPDLSLNAPLVNDDEVGSERLDQLVASDPLPDEQASTEIDGERRRRWLRRALRALNDREIRIIQARRLNEDSETLETLGARLGISKERVRQIESRALEKLRIALTQGPDVPRGAFGPA
jgi:RNA polymerase sigma-32 factor